MESLIIANLKQLKFIRGLGEGAYYRTLMGPEHYAHFYAKPPESSTPAEDRCWIIGVMGHQPFESLLTLVVPQLRLVDPQDLEDLFNRLYMAKTLVHSREPVVFKLSEVGLG